MRNDRGAYTNGGSVSDRDQVGERRFYYRVVPDPYIFADVNAAPTIEPNPQRCGTRRDSGEHLKNPVLYPWEKSFWHA
jgi:hypothetical protein